MSSDGGSGKPFAPNLGRVRRMRADFVAREKAQSAHFAPVRGFGVDFGWFGAVALSPRGG